MFAVTRRTRVLVLPAMVTSQEPRVPVPESWECQWQTTRAKSQAPRVPPPESYECQCQTNRANSVPAAGFPPWSRGCSCRRASLYSIKEPFWWEPPRPPPRAPLSCYLRHASLRIHRSLTSRLENTTRNLLLDLPQKTGAAVGGPRDTGALCLCGMLAPREQMGFGLFLFIIGV